MRAWGGPWKKDGPLEKKHLNDLFNLKAVCGLNTLDV